MKHARLRNQHLTVDDNQLAPPGRLLEPPAEGQARLDSVHGLRVRGQCEQDVTRCQASSRQVRQRQSGVHVWQRLSATLLGNSQAWRRWRVGYGARFFEEKEVKVDLPDVLPVVLLLKPNRTTTLSHCAHLKTSWR